MEPAIRSGDIVTIDHSAYEDAAPAVGDIVSILAPKGAETERCGVRRTPGAPCRRPTLKRSEDLGVIKRVIATGRQRVSIDPRGRAHVGGATLSEPYLQIMCAPGDRCALPRAIRVPPGHFFVLGDNRPYSSDSRSWGPVPLGSIEGRVTVAQEP